MAPPKECIPKKKIAVGVPTAEEIEEYFNVYETKAKHRRTLGTLRLECDESPEKFVADDLATLLKDVSELSLSKYYTPHENSEKMMNDKLDAIVTEVSQLSSLPYYTPNESGRLVESTNVNDSFKTANGEVITGTQDKFSETLANTTYDEEFSNERAEDISRTSIVDPRQDLKSVSNPFETAYESSFEEIAQTVGDIVKKLHLEVEEDSCIVISDDEDNIIYFEEEKIMAAKCSDVSRHFNSEQESDHKLHLAESSTSQAESLTIAECDENIFVKKENESYRENNYFNASSDVSCELYSYTKDGHESDCKMHRTGSSTSQADSLTIAECDKNIYVNEEYITYNEKINSNASSNVSRELYSYIKDDQESDCKMRRTGSSTSQSESHITSECEKRLHDDSSFNFNDTLDEINQLLAEETNKINDHSKDSGSYPALTTPHLSKIPLIVTPTRPLNKENNSQQEFKLPKKPTPKRVQPKYKDIKSPVALYIKNSPLAPLQRKLPMKPIKLTSPAVSCEKRPPLQEVLSLPQVVYAPAQKKVTTYEKPIKLPQVISKHMSPRGNIIKHEKRTNAHSRDVSKLLSDNNLTINATNNDDVSLLHVKEDFIV